MARHLNVFLLIVEPPERRVFYSEVVRGTPREKADKSGWLGRVQRGLRGIRARWNRSQAGAAKTGRKVWNWLHSRTHPDEPLYSRLRIARSIEMRYPSTMTDEEVTRAWKTFLIDGQWRHLPWFLANTAIAPLTLFIALLPGPNLIGYWFVYRAVHHAFILVGLARARSGRVTTRLVAVEALDRPIETFADPIAEAERLAALGLVTKPAKLVAFLSRQGLSGPPARSTVEASSQDGITTGGGIVGDD
ncbi:MAG: hypothetical protein AB7I30_00565 [Isosphaeraceae bacterium]